MPRVRLLSIRLFRRNHRREVQIPLLLLEGDLCHVLRDLYHKRSLHLHLNQARRDPLICKLSTVQVKLSPQ